MSLAPSSISAMCPACHAVVVSGGLPQAAFQFTALTLPESVRRMLFCSRHCAEEWLFNDADPVMIMRAVGGEVVKVTMSEDGIEVFERRPISGV